MIVGPELPAPLPCLSTALKGDNSQARMARDISYLGFASGRRSAMMVLSGGETEEASIG